MVVNTPLIVAIELKARCAEVTKKKKIFFHKNRIFNKNFRDLRSYFNENRNVAIYEVVIYIITRIKINKL